MTIDFSKIDKTKYYFDEKEALKAVNFIEKFCTHVKGDLAKKPFILENWQKEEIVMPLFGWKKKSDNKRKFKQAFIFLPRKNGKSTLAAAISLYMLIADNEQGSEGYFAAADREQARLCFDIVKGMIRNSKQLSDILEIYKDSIVFQKKNNSFKVISSDANTKHGYNTQFAVIDELHAHIDDDLYNVLNTSTGARSQPLIIVITTAGQNQNHICYDLYDYSKKVLQGIIKDETFFPVIYELEDVEKSIDNPENWLLANPSMDISLRRDYLETESSKALIQPNYENVFRQLHLNQWVQSNKIWIEDRFFIQNKVQFDPKELEGCECFGGLDLASSRDINSFSLYFPTEKKLLQYNWIPKQAATNKNNIAKGVPLFYWESIGLIKFAGEIVADQEIILADINELKNKYNIKLIAFDRWGSDNVKKYFDENNIPNIEFGQGFKSMSEPTKEFEKMLIENSLDHNQNPVLRWGLSNTVITTDAAQNQKPDKAKSKNKIDMVVSAIISIGGYLRYKNGLVKEEKKPETESYQDRGFITI